MIDPTVRYLHIGRLWVTPGYTMRVDLGDPRQPRRVWEGAGSVCLTYDYDIAEQVHRLHGHAAKVFSRGPFVESVSPL